MAGIGEALRSTRERRGLSIDQVAQDTRISPRFLEALEEEQFSELPAPVYVRGFLRSYANYLRIEPQPLLEQLVGAEAGSPTIGGYIGGSGGSRRNDPFQRGGVVVAPVKPAAPVVENPVDAPDPDDEGWAPEPPAPFSPAPVDHGYIPGSDLMEAPEHHEVIGYAEPEPIFAPRTAGVLAERPPGPREPGIPRTVAILGGGVAAVLAFLLLAVFVTRGDGDGTNQAAATGGGTPAITPGTVIPLGTQASSATAGAAALASVTATGSPSATTNAAVSESAATTTPKPTTASGTATPTATATPSVTEAPTATPTLFVPTPTVVAGPPAHPATYSACDISKASEKCGSAYVRVICFPPFAETDPTGVNDNWFVDVSGSYPLQGGWREITVYAPTSIGPVIKAGQYGCR